MSVLRFCAAIIAFATALGFGLALFGIWALSLWGGFMYAKSLL